MTSQSVDDQIRTRLVRSTRDAEVAALIRTRNDLETARAIIGTHYQALFADRVHKIFVSPKSVDVESHGIGNPVADPLPGRSGVIGDQCQPVRTNHNSALRCPEVHRKQRLVRTVGN
ncbi:hypothetical protein D9M70_556910 [compost metagenome]